MKQWKLLELVEPKGVRSFEDLVGRRVRYRALDLSAKETVELVVRVREVGNRLAPTDIHGFIGTLDLDGRTIGVLGSYSMRRQEGDLMEHSP